MRDIAIVIPTYNRARLLERTLGLLNEQTFSTDRYETIVVDDGSSDDTEKTVTDLRDKVSYKLKYIKQDHKGPAAARNMGVRQAESRFILFMGDDIFPEKDLIMQHMNSLTRDPDCAILGYVGWSEEGVVTEFMRYLAPNGFQFRYNTIRDPDDCDYKHFYTSNISLAKEWLIEDPFDEDFPYGAMEDAELSYRLKKKGLKIIFNNKAIGYHNHGMSVDSFSRRMYLTGISSAITFKKHPELKRGLVPINVALALPVFSVLARMTFIEKIHKELYWFLRIVSSYLEGVRESVKKCKKV